MKYVGQMSNGCKLVEMSTAEWSALNILIGLVGDAAPESPAVVVPDPAPEILMRSKHIAPPRARKPAKAGKAAGAIPARVCLKCGKSFRPVRKDQGCCSKACRRGAPKTPTPQTDPPTAPGVDKAARLEALRAAGERVGLRVVARPSAESEDDQ